MSRRRTGAVLAALALPLAALTMPAAHAEPAAPNVVLILLDDARIDDLSAVPAATSRIGGQGATLSRFYAPFPLCCPARATLLTGQYAHNHGVVANKAPAGGFSKFQDASTLATWLAPSYRTGLVGKYFNGYAANSGYVPPGWDEWYSPAWTYNYEGTRWLTATALTGNVYRTLPGYQTDTMGALAADFVKRNAPGDEPFFLYTALVGPHVGSPADPDDPVGWPTPYVKPRYRDSYAGTTNTHPSFNEADVSDKPAKPLLSDAEVAAATEAMQQRREAMLSVNDATTQILDAVDASGEARDTVVWFMSDNGYILGEHRIRSGKVAPYEVANHVPSMVRGPGIPAGSTLGVAASQVDFAATVADWAGVEPGLPQDGVSLASALSGAAEPHPPIAIEGADADTGVWAYRGVVSQDGWKYVKRTRGGEELYDLASDPAELSNVARVKAYAARKAELAALSLALQDCAGTSCRLLRPREDAASLRGRGGWS